MTMASGVQAKSSLDTRALMSQAHDNVNSTAKVFSNIGRDLKARLNSSYYPELAEACTCVNRVVVLYENAAKELQTFLWVGRFEGENGKRSPSAVAKAKQNFADSFRTTKQKEFKNFRGALYSRYEKLKATLNALDRADGPIYRAEIALSALEKKTKPIPLWRERVQKTCLVIGLVLGAACIVTVIGVAIAASGGTLGGVTVAGMRGLYAALSSGPAVGACTSAVSYLCYNRSKERARHGERAKEVQKALQDAKGYVVDMRSIEGAFNSLDVLGDAADKDVDDIVQIFMDLFEPKAEKYETVLPQVKKDIEMIKRWLDDVSQD